MRCKKGVTSTTATATATAFGHQPAIQGANVTGPAWRWYYQRDQGKEEEEGRELAVSRSVGGAPGDEMVAAFDGLCRAVVEHMTNGRLNARKAADIGWVRRGS